MWNALVIGFLLVSWIWFYLRIRKEEERFRHLESQLDATKQEEMRVFEFLRGLGEVFTEDIRSGELHRLIVDSAVRIYGAQGGALYLLDREGRCLVPGAISDCCPPVVEIPARILQQGESTPAALQSYLRVHAVAPGEGVVGQVWQDGEPVLLAGDDPQLAPMRDTKLRTASAMFAPLIYGDRKLGVLALANGPMNRPFTESDFTVFRAITEQSAFALYNAVIHRGATDKRQLDQDLLVAQDIQRILLPSGDPRMERYEISGVNIPARHVSGDFYAYVELEEGRLGVAIADVSGKGVPASLIMATCRGVLHSHAPASSSPSAVLHRVNRQIYPDIKEDMFISMAYVVLDNESPQVMLCRAGHDAPLHYSAREQKITRLNPPGMALGIDSGEVFNRITRDFPITLEPGDCLILYTDGVTEALDANGSEFGWKKMMQSIQTSAPRGAAGIIQALTAEVLDFIGTHPKNDDITLVAIRRK